MKLLMFSDLHCDIQAAELLVQTARDVDVVIGAGDFATMRKGLEQTIEILQQIDRPSILVPGNAESDEELTNACSQWPQAHILHGTGCELDGVSFFGLGAAVPVTPFGTWSFDLDEIRATQLLESCPDGGVLVTHSPPLGVLDRSSTRKKLGSKAVLTAIKKHQPRLHVCGHIHDCWGQTEQIGSTAVVNAGPQGVVWELQ